MAGSEGIILEPAWPNLTMDELIQKAFRDYVIPDIEHPIARELLGDNTSETTSL